MSAYFKKMVSMILLFVILPLVYSQTVLDISCSLHGKKKTCVEDCDCRWCNSNDRCIQSGFYCKNKTSETDQCQKQAKNNGLAAIIIFSLICGCLMLTVLFFILSRTLLCCCNCLKVTCSPYFAEAIDFWNRCRQRREGHSLMDYSNL